MSSNAAARSLEGLTNVVSEKQTVADLLLPAETTRTAATLPETTEPQREAMRRIPVIAVACSDTPQPNVALLRLDLRAALPIVVHLENEADIPQTRRIEVLIDGIKRYTSNDIVLSGRGEERHDFTITFESGGLHEGDVRLVGTDGNRLDDKLFFAVEVDRGIPVALVKGSSHELPFLEDSYYIESALSTGGNGISPIRPTTLTPEELASEPLGNYAAVICVNMSPLAQETAERLIAYVERGGNLIWTAGDQIDIEEYNTLHARLHGKLLPARLRPRRTPRLEEGRESWSIRSLDGGYPAFRNLVHPRELYTSVLVYKHIPFEPEETPESAAPSSSVRVLAALDDDSPLLILRPLGRGTVSMFGVPPHVSWTNLPLKPIFVPLINQ